MSKLSARVGMWAAVIETACSAIYLLGLIIATSALFSQLSAAEVAATRWTNIQVFAAHYADHPFNMQVSRVIFLAVILSSIMIPVIILALHEITEPEKKIFTRIASAFAIGFMVYSCWGYYIQLASVHTTIITGGDLDGLAQFVESNFFSPGMATLQLSWTIFYGLTTLAVVPVFGSTKIEKWIKGLFIANGVVGLIVGFVYALGNYWLLPLSILTLVVVSAAYPLLAIVFRRLSTQPQKVFTVNMLQ